MNFFTPHYFKLKPPILGFALSLAWASLDAASASPAPALRGEIGAAVNRDYASLDLLYKHLHTHPELSFQEKATAARLAAELRQAGFEVTEGVGGFGVVGVMRQGVGPTVLIRADMDALPVKEQTGLAYESKAKATDPEGKTVDVMHACGHDIHMTVFAGAARMVAQFKQHWSGTILMVAQPAEERGGGASLMLKAGLYERFPKPNFCVALHAKADLPAGMIGMVEGYAMANVDMLDITMRGVGGHGAWPHTTKDPVVLAAQAIMAYQTIVSRETEPGKAAVVTVGSIHGGTKHNIISDEVKLQLTLRSFTDEVRSNTLASVKRISLSMAAAAGVPPDRQPIFEEKDEFVPALYNDPPLTGRLRTAFTDWLGADRVTQVKPVMGGEDFSQFGRTVDKVPVCLFWLGTVDPSRYAASQKSGEALPSLHSSFYAPLPEPTIKTGVLAMTAAVLELAGKR